MKRLAIAAIAASLLCGGAAVAQPMHPAFGGGHQGPAGGFRPTPAPFHPGPVGVHQGPTGFRPGPVVFHPGQTFGAPRVYPVGFRHWGYGEYLPAAWLVSTNYVADFAAYDLGAPPAGYEWIENGPDALLVDLSTGMVVQVVPGAFA